MSVHHIYAWCLQRPDENVFQGSNFYLPTDPSLAHTAFLELLQHDTKAQILQWNAWLNEGRVKGSSREKKGDWRSADVPGKWGFLHLTKPFNPPADFIAVTGSDVDREGQSGGMESLLKSPLQ